MATPVNFERTSIKKRNSFIYTDQTMSVRELISELQKYPTETKVLASWEGTVHAILPERIDLDTFENQKCVFF